MAEEKGERRSPRNKSENDKEKEIITIEVGENTRQKDDNAEQSIEGTNKPIEEENTQEKVTSDQNIKIIKFTVGEKDEDRRSRSGRKIKTNRKYSNPDKQEDLVFKFGTEYSDESVENWCIKDLENKIKEEERGRSALNDGDEKKRKKRKITVQKDGEEVYLYDEKQLAFKMKEKYYPRELGDSECRNCGEDKEETEEFRYLECDNCAKYVCKTCHKKDDKEIDYLLKDEWGVYWFCFHCSSKQQFMLIKLRQEKEKKGRSD